MIHDDVDQVSAFQLLETMNLNLHGIVRARLYYQFSGILGLPNTVNHQVFATYISKGYFPSTRKIRPNINPEQRSREGLI